MRKKEVSDRRGNDGPVRAGAVGVEVIDGELTVRFLAWGDVGRGDEGWGLGCRLGEVVCCIV